MDGLLVGSRARKKKVRFFFFRNRDPRRDDEGGLYSAVTRNEAEAK